MVTQTILIVSSNAIDQNVLHILPLQPSRFTHFNSFSFFFLRQRSPKLILEILKNLTYLMSRLNPIYSSILHLVKPSLAAPVWMTWSESSSIAHIHIFPTELQPSTMCILTTYVACLFPFHFTSRKNP